MWGRFEPLVSWLWRYANSFIVDNFCFLIHGGKVDCVVI